MKNLIKYLVIISLIMYSCNENGTSTKVGIIAPLTGEGATYGSAMKRGFDLAFDSADSYELIYEDSKLSAKDGINAINKLINFDGVEVVYGAAASSVTLAMSPEAEKNKRVLFSSISTADDIKNSGDYIFRNVPPNSLQGEKAANFLVKGLNCKNVAVLKENDDYGISIAKSFSKEIKKLGANILIEDTYVSTDSDFKTQLTKIKKSNPDGIFIPGNYEESALILKQAKELGIGVPIIGGDGSYSQDLIKVTGAASEGFYCTHFAFNEKDNFYNNFKTKFVEKYGEVPDVYEAYAYEAGTILLASIQNSGNNGEKIKNYLLSNSFPSLTGELSFDKLGEVKRNFGVLKVENSKFVNVK